MTRFTYDQIIRICEAAKIDLRLKFNDLVVPRELALAMLLYRLSFTRRLVDMIDVFGMSEDNIGRTVNGMSLLLFHKFKT